jgi:hypothetical protein
MHLCAPVRLPYTPICDEPVIGAISVLTMPRNVNFVG